MINPETLDLKSLPWLPLEEKTAFPKKSAIYFAIDSLGNVQYIGRTKNLNSRWVSHHRYEDLRTVGNVRVAYLVCDDSEILSEFEDVLIDYFNPPLNTIRSNPNPHNLPIKLKLRELREAKKVTQREMALLLETTETNYRRIEGQKIESIAYKNLDKLCKFFNCTPNDLLEFIND